MKLIRRIIIDGEIKASFSGLSTWIVDENGWQVAITLGSEDIKCFYHKKARLVLEVKP